MKLFLVILIIFTSFSSLACGMSPIALYEQHNLRTNEYIKTHPDLNAKKKRAIRDGRVIIGMTEAEVVLVKGPPQEVNYLTTEDGTTSQWIYGYNRCAARGAGDYCLEQYQYFVPTYYFYFKEGILTAIQE